MLLAISQLARLSPDNYPRIQQANILPRVRTHALVYTPFTAPVRFPCEPRQHRFLVEEPISHIHGLTIKVQFYHHLILVQKSSQQYGRQALCRYLFA